MTLRASTTKHSTKKSSGSPAHRRTTATAAKKTSQQTQPDAYDLRKAAYDQYLLARNGWNRCLSAGCPTAPTAVPPPGERPTAPPRATTNTTAAPTITPQQAAYVAIARLHLTPPQPVIGPSPDLNDWHIAAVGYPYWLWTNTNLNPPPVSTTVADLTVTLHAHLASTTFDLGDGTHLTCTDLTTPWTPAVEPATPSPTCGHTYTRPSLPRASYTITATSTWAVDWTVNGTGGTIPLTQQATTTLPVGELQVLTH